MPICSMMAMVVTLPNSNLTPSRSQNIETEINTSKLSTGATRWKMSDESSPWASKLIDEEFLERCRVVAVAAISEDDIIAWDSKGKRDKNFEFFLKTKVKHGSNSPFLMQYGKKSRVIFIEYFNSRPGESRHYRIPFSLKGVVNQIRDFSWYAPQKLSSKMYCYSLCVDKDAGFANIPISINVSASAKAIRLRVGEKFKKLGQTFEISEIRPFQDSDRGDFPVYMHSGAMDAPSRVPKSTVVVKTKIESSTPFVFQPDISLAWKLAPEQAPPENKYLQLTSEGVLQQIEKSTESNLTVSTPGIHLTFCGGRKSLGELYFASFANPDVLRMATPCWSESVTLQILDIPLELKEQ